MMISHYVSVSGLSKLNALIVCRLKHILFISLYSVGGFGCWLNLATRLNVGLLIGVKIYLHPKRSLWPDLMIEFFPEVQSTTEVIISLRFGVLYAICGGLMALSMALPLRVSAALGLAFSKQAHILGEFDD